MVAKAVEAPLNQIAVNAGLEGGVIVDKVRNLKKPTEGLNAATGEYEDLIKAGVIDAAKVTRSALQNAASIAALFLTTEASSSTSPKRSRPPCPAAEWTTTKPYLLHHEREHTAGRIAPRCVRYGANFLGARFPVAWAL